jgi:hypothetical protein
MSSIAAKAADEAFLSFRLANGANPMTLSAGDNLEAHHTHVAELLYRQGFDAYALRRLAEADDVDALYTMIFAAIHWEQ